MSLHPLTPGEADMLDERIVELCRTSLRGGMPEHQLWLNLNMLGYRSGKAESFIAEAIRRDESGRSTFGRDAPSTTPCLVREDKFLPAPVGRVAPGRGFPNRLRVIEGGRNG